MEQAQARDEEEKIMDCYWLCEYCRQWNHYLEPCEHCGAPFTFNTQMYTPMFVSKQVAGKGEGERKAVYSTAMVLEERHYVD